MLGEPTIEQRSEQPYAAIRRKVTMQTIGAVLPEIHPNVFAWLGKKGIAPAGAPFWKYNVIDMEAQMEVEVGVPVAAAVSGAGEVLGGVLPAGRYATVWHTGHPSELMTATASLLDWAAGQDLKWDKSESEHGEVWTSRLEIYETDPAEEPDMTKWRTQLAFKLAD
jgi:effector-binding domain-containing protein